MDHISDNELVTDQLTNDIIAAFREQVRRQNEEIMAYRVFLRGLRETTPHDWLRNDITQVLKEDE